MPHNDKVSPDNDKLLENGQACLENWENDVSRKYQGIILAKTSGIC